MFSLAGIRRIETAVGEFFIVGYLHRAEPFPPSPLPLSVSGGGHAKLLVGVILLSRYVYTCIPRIRILIYRGYQLLGLIGEEVLGRIVRRFIQMAQCGGSGDDFPGSCAVVIVKLANRLSRFQGGIRWGAFISTRLVLYSACFYCDIVCSRWRGASAPARRRTTEPIDAASLFPNPRSSSPVIARYVGKCEMRATTSWGDEQRASEV